MSHKLLSADGSIRELESGELASVVLIDPSDTNAAATQLSELASDQVALMELPSSADGRAFSLLGSLLAKQLNKPNVWLGGDVLPDQVSLAFQCGAQAVLVSEKNWQARGEQDWTAALRPPVTQLYRSEVWSGVSNISSLRQSQPAG